MNLQEILGPVNSSFKIIKLEPTQMIITTVTATTATENIAAEQINIAHDQHFYYKLHKCIKYIKEIQELKEMINEAERERA